MANGKFYVPILMWKKGEQDALIELDSEIKKHIIPLIEITPSSNFDKLSDQIEKCWKKRLFYFDLLPECYEENDGSIYFDLLEKCPSEYVIPVLNITDSVEVIDEAKNYGDNGIALRIAGGDFEEIEDKLNALAENNSITPKKTDIILDLSFVDEDSVYDKKSVLKVAIADINNIGQYRKIIVASNSFPNTFPKLEIGELYSYDRFELQVHKAAQMLADKYKFSLVYSDYGPFNLKYQEYILGMIPVFKVRYSTDKEYLYARGLSLKKGGLDPENIKEICKLIVNSDSYYGDDFSWGDAFISEVYNGRSKCGNLTTWVQVAMNHHITVIINQISSLL